jgi:L-fucose isomerase-like protein
LVNPVATDPLCIGFVGLYFPNFAALQYDVFSRSVEAMKVLAADWGFELECADEAIMHAEEAELARRKFELADVDFVLVQSSSFSMGDVYLPLGQMDVPIGLWALREPSFEGPNPLNSFTGFNMLSSITRLILQDRVYPFKWFYGDAEDEQFQHRLQLTIRALQTLKSIRGARLALVGDIAPTFYHLTHNADAIVDRLGIHVDQIPLRELFLRANGIDKSRLSDTVLEMGQQAREVSVEEPWMHRTAQAGLALRDISTEGGYSALALRCFPEFQTEMDGLGPCAAVSWLNEVGYPTACEGDVMSAISMLILQIFSKQPATVLDLAAVHDREGLVHMWHCGPSPASFADDNGMRITHHPTLDRAGPPTGPSSGVAVDLQIAPGPVTLFQILPDVDRAFLATAEIVQGPTEGFHGSRGWLDHVCIDAAPMSVFDLIETVSYHGLTQHYPIAQGDFNDVLREMLAWIGIKILEPISYRPYLVVPEHSS